MGAGVLSLLDRSTQPAPMVLAPTGSSIVESGALGLLVLTPKLIQLGLHH